MSQARSPDEIRTSIETTRQELAFSVNDLRSKVAEITNWRRQLAENRQAALVGAAVAGAPARQPLLGNMLALAGAMCVSAYLLTGRQVAARFSLLVYVTLVYAAAATVLVVAAVAAGVELGRYPAAGWWALAPGQG